MASPAILNNKAAPQPQASSAAVASIIPFTRASKEHAETMLDVSVPLLTTLQQLGPYDVPAYGYMRHIVLYVTATGGVGSSVTASADGPWNVLADVSLIDVSGTPIVQLDGYSLYLANKYGGYKPNNDPKQYPSFSAVAAGSGNFAFKLRVPLEVSSGRDGLCALPNQNAASTFKIRLQINPSTTVYGVVPATTLPTIRIRASLEAWMQPYSQDVRGIAQATQPPADGTTAFWSKTIFNIPAGQQTPRLNRTGNLIRNLIFVYRDNSSVRVPNSSANWPDPLVLFVDTRPLALYPWVVWQDIISERTGLNAAVETAGGLDNGVWVYDFCHEFDGRIGAELRDGWLQTVQSTRLEVQGTFGAAGSLTVLTNDVSPNGEVYV